MIYNISASAGAKTYWGGKTRQGEGGLTRGKILPRPRAEGRDGTGVSVGKYKPSPLERQS